MAIPQPFDVEDVVADSEDEDFMPKLTATGVDGINTFCVTTEHDD